MSLAFTHSLSLSLSRISLSFTHKHTHKQIHLHAHTLSLSLSHTHTHTSTLPQTYTYTHLRIKNPHSQIYLTQRSAFNSPEKIFVGNSRLETFCFCFNPGWKKIESEKRHLCTNFALIRLRVENDFTRTISELLSACFLSFISTFLKMSFWHRPLPL